MFSFIAIHVSILLLLSSCSFEPPLPSILSLLFTRPRAFSPSIMRELKAELTLNDTPVRKNVYTML